jgi:transcriptional regulator with XRE-family HTH domain
MTPEKFRQLVGQRVRALRQEQGLSGSDFARLMRRSRSWVSDAENGRENFTLETLSRFAEALGHDELDLLTFPERNVRQAVIDLTRVVPEDALHDAKTFLLRARDNLKKSEERQRRLRLRVKG